MGEVGRLRERVARLRRFLDANPLARARLWHGPGTSQKQAVGKAIAGAVALLVFVILGGNRSGKTEAGAQLAVAFALGRDHPAVIAWGLLNGLDLTRIQRGPGVVCCSALTSNDSIRVQREKVAAYLPEGTEWSNRHGHGEAVARLPNGGTLLFKSNDQRARAYQGADWHFLWMDEEHDEAVFNEARMRLADHAGLAVFTMTPLKGRTWVWRRFVNLGGEHFEGDCGSYALNSRDNPYVPQDYLDRLLAKYGPHERAARERGEFTALEGRVYEFSRAIHVIPAFPIPLDWPRYQGWDFGTRNPACVLWVAVDPSDDVMHIYRAHHRAGWTTKEHAEHVLAIETCPTCKGEPVRSQDDDFEGVDKDAFETEGEDGNLYAFGSGRARVELVCRTCRAHPGRTEPEPEWRVADPAAKGDRKTLARHHGIHTIPARNDVRPGINAVSERLAPDANGDPHLVVHDCCHPVIDEFEGYIWDTTKRKGNDADTPLKLNDHAMDVARYIAFRLKRAGSFGATA